jgi:multiple sugar transport system ATP-binding protein
MGNETFVYFKAGGQQFISRIDSVDSRVLESGNEHIFIFDMENCHIFDYDSEENISL